MINEGRVEELLSEISPSVSRKNNKMGFICRCPVCGDSQKSERIRRLHVDFYHKYDDWICKCYNGGCEITDSTNFISLYAKVKGLSYKQAKKIINNEIFDVQKAKERLSKKTIIKEEYKEPDITFLLSDEWLSVDSEPKDRFQERFIHALDLFIKERYIPINYKIFVAYDGEYKGRVIIPIFIDGELKYFQGRALFDIIEPKYKNPDVDKELIISNSDKFDRNKNIVVTEGLIDSWMVEDHQGTSCLGSFFSDELIKQLYEYTDKDIILCFDNPLIDKAGFKEISKFIKKSKYKNKVKYFFVNDSTFKDLNELRIQRPDLCIYDFIQDHSYSLYSLKAKLKLLYKYNI
jgi:hypothetical protein